MCGVAPMARFSFASKLTGCQMIPQVCVVAPAAEAATKIAPAMGFWAWASAGAI
jgi:hypothetical protein